MMGIFNDCVFSLGKRGEIFAGKKVNDVHYIIYLSHESKKKFMSEDNPFGYTYTCYCVPSKNNPNLLISTKYVRNKKIAPTIQIVSDKVRGIINVLIGGRRSNKYSYVRNEYDGDKFLVRACVKISRDRFILENFTYAEVLNFLRLLKAAIQELSQFWGDTWNSSLIDLEFSEYTKSLSQSFSKSKEEKDERHVYIRQRYGNRTQPAKKRVSAVIVPSNT